ncbi:Radical SAM domain protein [Methanococcus maripaludis C5]|uniref:Radical SAM domain protein n=1 Tax=Methanococcus maripaludis (strain C5 / ATCC BAA-1333) TaxID=402880 RepID=A4FX47_METM5|nr:radical SAM protein [Methanococcus maripaludis]ABO34776.1 Radical SAM domain protein [Methanococcus maripaludis C5]
MAIKNVSIVYPNKFGGGIACLAVHVLTNHLNKYHDISANAYLIENYSKIKNSDAILITLQYENDYFNVVKIVKELKTQNPNAIFIAGGPCAISNPLPLHEFFDVFVVGEIEGTDTMYQLINGNFEIPGVYVPKTYNNEKIKRIYPKKLGIKDYPIAQVTHESGAYGKAYLLEIGRGCIRNCKFCMAKCIYAPPRYRKIEDLKYLVDEGLKNTDADKVSLIAPSVSDYRYVLDLCAHISEKNVSISPSSLRADTITDELLDYLNLKTLTIAPEAGSEVLRKKIDKGITEENILNAVDIAKNHGISTVKLYYMVGFPEETEEDIEEIITLTKKIKENVRKVDVSINPMVPKPHTPFEDFEFDMDSKMKIKYIEKSLRKIKVSVDFEKFNSMVAQTVLARGGVELSKVLNESKNTMQLIKNVDLDNYINKIEEKPWDFIEI